MPPSETRINHTRHSNFTDGFSLVEIVIAIGILSFTFVALMGLIPVGLKAFSGAIDATVETQILQVISTRARQTKFTDLASLNLNADDSVYRPSADYFFDDQGRELKPATGEPAIYGAAVVVMLDATQKPYTNYPSQPASGGASVTSNNQIATLKIVVTKISAPKEQHVSFVHIANNGL